MRDILVTITYFGALPLVFKKPQIGVYLWAWIGYMNPHRLGWGFAYNFPFGVIAATAIILSLVIARKNITYFWSPIFSLLIILNIWFLITTFFSIQPDISWAQWEKVIKIQLIALMIPWIIKLKIVKIRQAIRAVESEFKNFADSQFVPAEPTMNIGMIRTLDDHVRISGCVRLPPTVGQAAYEDWMQRLRAACREQGAEFRIGDYKPPFRTKEQADIIEVCQNTLSEMGLSSELTAQSVANEANVYSKFGLDVVVWGPGQGVGNSHTPNECVKRSDLDAARNFYRRIMRRVSL